MIDHLLCLSPWEVKFASREMVEGLDRLPVYPPGCKIREMVHWLATGPGRISHTDLMSLLAIGIDIHHMHLCDITWCMIEWFVYLLLDILELERQDWEQGSEKEPDDQRQVEGTTMAADTLFEGEALPAMMKNGVKDDTLGGCVVWATVAA
ncbi:hypothetical protein PIB30_082610 [Stylosanthes scabra]|uniref:Uncharacterized protein n=1 Tax=Stylosanthes scabra TaxID=79078 RepID=A0ABU6YR37_9FABA|nr:hypothetical protein [Stylosanthes scabra]